MGVRFDAYIVEDKVSGRPYNNKVYSLLNHAKNCISCHKLHETHHVRAYIMLSTDVVYENNPEFRQGPFGPTISKHVWEQKADVKFIKDS